MPKITSDELAAVYREADEAAADFMEAMAETVKAWERWQEKRRAKSALKAQFDNQIGNTNA